MKDIFADAPESKPGMKDIFADSPTPDPSPAPAPTPAPTPAPDPKDVVGKVARRAELAQELMNRGEQVSLREFLEPLMAIGSSVLAEPVAGIAGITGSVLPGRQGQGAEWVEKTREAMTYEPKTEKGRQTTGEIGELMAPASEAFSDVEKALGDYAFELTGNPAAATVAASSPTALLEIMGLGGLRKMRQGVRLIDDAGEPTRELRKALDKQGLDYENMTPEVREMIPQEVEPTLLPGGNPIREPVEQALAQQLKTGATDDALATLKLDRYGNVVPDEAATRAIKQGFTPGLVQSVKASTPETKGKMQQMLKQMRQIKKNERVAMDRRPAAVVGDSVKNRITFVREKIDTANKQLQDIVQNRLDGVDIDTYKVQRAFTDALDELGIELPDDLTLSKKNFKGSDVELNPPAQKAFKDVLELLKDGDGAADAARAHQVKRILDELIDYKKASSTKLTPKNQRILKKVRRSLNESIREVDPEYANFNDIVADGLDALSDFNDALGRKTDIFDPGSERGIGQELRKLMSNYGNRVVLDDSLRQLDEVAAQFGGRFNDDVRTLSMFANALDNRFGTVAKTSLQGVMESAGNDKLASLAAESLVSPKTAAARGVLEVGKKAADKLKGVNEFNAFEAMDDLLKRTDQ